MDNSFRSLPGRIRFVKETNLFQVLQALPQVLKQRCPQAKLVCLDIQPYTTAQAQNRSDILNIGGFSDHVFSLIGEFAQNGMSADFWVNEIEKIALPAVQ